MPLLIRPFAERNHVYHLPGKIITQQRKHPLLRELYLSSTGRFDRAVGHHVVRTDQEATTHLLIVCLGGQGYFRTAGTEWPVGTGDVMVGRQHEAHTYAADGHEPWSIAWVHFSGTQAGDYLTLMGIEPGRQRLQIGEQSQIIAVFNELFQTLRAGYTLHHLVMVAASLRRLLSLLAMLDMYADDQPRTGLNVAAIIDFMNAHLHENLTLDDIAAQASMSRSHFTRRFRARTGYAPIDYFIRLKIQRACELLETTDWPIAEVSQSLGYTDPYYFSRLFKRIIGLAPSHYRNTREFQRERSPRN